MLIIVLIVIITVVLLIGMDRVSGRQTTAGRSRKAADDRFLYRFLHRQSHRRPQQSPDTRIPSQINHEGKSVSFAALALSETWILDRR